MASTSKLITLTEEMKIKLGELKAELGYNTESMVIYHAISTLYQKTFPPHTQVMRKGPEDMVKRKQQEKAARESLDHERKLELLKQLKGTLEANDIAIYFTYTGRKRYRQETPLHLLTEEVLAAQYSPDKKTVEALQKAKKVDY